MAALNSIRYRNFICNQPKENFSAFVFPDFVFSEVMVNYFLFQVMEAKLSHFPCDVLSSVSSLIPPYFSTLSQTARFSGGGGTEHKLFDFLYNFYLKYVFILKAIKQYIAINVKTS
jgi:hypothetical protein